MKKLMMTTAGAALMLGVVACSDASTDTADTDTTTQETAATETEMADAETDMEPAEEAVAVKYLGANEFPGKELIGADIMDANDEVIATVEDLVVGPDGSVQSVLIDAGDFDTIESDMAALPVSSAEMLKDDEGEPYFMANVTPEELTGALVAFEPEGMNNYNLVSEMVGATADFASGDEEAEINDVILAKNGRLKYAVAANGMVGSIGGEDRMVPFNMITVEQGDGGGLVINASPEEFETMQPFEYENGDDGLNPAMGDMEPAGETESDSEY